MKLTTVTKHGHRINIQMPQAMMQKILWREYAAQQWELRKRVIPS